MKVAVVGDALSTRHLAPFNDPEWEIWATGNSYLHVRRLTRYFELHRWADVAATVRVERALETAGGHATFWEAPTRLGATHVYVGPEVPNHFLGGPQIEPFPFETMLTRYPRRYFTSSFSWLLAFALSLDDVTDLGVYGFDLSLTEYQSQRGAIEYFIGRFDERLGEAHVQIAPRSMIMRAPFLYALDTAANRQARSVLADQRGVLEKELATRKTVMEHAFVMRTAATNRYDEHRAVCPVCMSGSPCERRELIRSDFFTAVRNENQSNIEYGQIRARLDESTYYMRNLIVEDVFAPDAAREDDQLPLFAEPITDEYRGVQHTFPLPKEIVANVRSNGEVDYEIAGGPTITETL